MNRAVRRAVTLAGTILGLVLMQASAAWAITVPNPAPATPPGMEAPTNTILGWMKWGGMIGVMIGVGTGLIMMAVGRRNRHALAVDGVAGIPWALSAGVGFSVMSAVIGAIFGG